MSFLFQPPSCSRTNHHYYVFWPSASCFRLPAVQELPHSLHGKRKHQQLSLVWWVRTFLFWCPSCSRAAWLRKHTFTAQREAMGLSLGRQVKRPCFSKRLCCKNMLYITLTDCRSSWMERRHVLLTWGRLKLSNPFSPNCCAFRMHQDVGTLQALCGEKHRQRVNLTGLARTFTLPGPSNSSQLLRFSDKLSCREAPGTMHGEVSSWDLPIPPSCCIFQINCPTEKPLGHCMER